MESGHTKAVSFFDRLMKGVYGALGISYALSYEHNIRYVRKRLDEAPINEFLDNELKAMIGMQPIAVRSVKDPKDPPAFVAPGHPGVIFINSDKLDGLVEKESRKTGLAKDDVKRAILLHEYGHLMTGGESTVTTYVRRVLPAIIGLAGKHLLTKFAISTIEKKAASANLSDKQKDMLFLLIVVIAVTYTIAEMLAVSYFSRRGEMVAYQQAIKIKEQPLKSYLQSMQSSSREDTTSRDLTKLLQKMINEVNRLFKTHPDAVQILRSLK